MKDSEWKEYLQQETEPERLGETIKLCVEIMREQRSWEEPRTNFVQYLSDIFRFEGIPVFGLQTGTLFLICLGISTIADSPKYLPVFIPLLVLAVIPLMFKCRYYGMSEIEAATRASGSQIVLAKLILAGAADLVCMTVLIFLEVYLQNSCREIGQMVLYCLVPYLICMISMLRLIRLGRTGNIQIWGIVPGSCMCWGMLAKALPQLYNASALGLWIAAFLFFTAFFIKEIYFIITTGKEGKMYGIIA